jgi:oxygen-independent coproporphyrinogen III oxidase
MTILPAALLRQLDRPGPRYTSYPTADRFHEGVSPEDYAQALRRRGQDTDAPPLSVYVHVPFCASVCYYCACHKIVTRHHDRAAPYLQTLRREIALHREALGRPVEVSQLHLGGGTPTFLNDAELAELVAALREGFAWTPDAEVSIEVDPRTASPERLAHLRRLGFNRLSFGVQDFDPAVQAAVHREQSLESVQQLMEAARALGFESLNIDLIYGLPLQTPESVKRTVETVLTLAPDRVALYAYAHLPERFKPQRRIDPAQLPAAADRLAMLGGAIERFTGAGYDYIGMDHFARPDDRLAVARREGRLHRNFMGYTTHPDSDMIGLGASSIGSVAGLYAQNDKTLEGWTAAIEAGRFSTCRGWRLDDDDARRRDAILALMCQGDLDTRRFEARWGVPVAEAFASEIHDLQPLADAGLVAIDPQGVHVKPLGWYAIRAIAAGFDRHLSGDQRRERFSQLV